MDTIRSWRIGRAVLAGLALLLVNGCATTRPMALGKEATALSTATESVALLSVKLANRYKPSWQPNLLYVFVWQDGTEKRERYSFKVDDPVQKVPESFNEYLVSLSLPPGRYVLREFFGSSGVFPVRAHFGTPVFARFELKPAMVVYLGHIEATIRERKEDSELRAGPLLPLIDQAVAGFSGGTFDIEIVDRYEGDMAEFTRRHPFLSTHGVERVVLPPWQRPTEKDME